MTQVMTCAMGLAHARLSPDPKIVKAVILGALFVSLSCIAIGLSGSSAASTAQKEAPTCKCADCPGGVLCCCRTSPTCIPTTSN